MDVLSSLHNQKRIGMSGGIYARTQQLFAYHSRNHERGYLRDTCLTAQDRYKTYLDMFGIDYPKDETH